MFMMMMMMMMIVVVIIKYILMKAKNYLSYFISIKQQL